MSNSKTPNSGKGPTKSLGSGSVWKKNQGRPAGTPIKYGDGQQK